MGRDCQFAKAERNAEREALRQRFHGMGHEPGNGALGGIWALPLMSGLWNNQIVKERLQFCRLLPKGSKRSGRSR